jgi:two-component system, OmpR family, phosphate regulon sensor histidine kinase PhoR
MSQLDTSDSSQSNQSTSNLLSVNEELLTNNRELSEEKARADAMLQNIGDAVVGVNDKGEITFVNKQVGLMVGFSDDELIGKYFTSIVRTVDENNAEVPVNNNPLRNALFNAKKIVNKDYYYIRKDGTKFPVAITATPVFAGGQIIGGANVFRDITQEKEVDRMKTEFISLASHQLRTPLSAMKWFCELLLDGDVGEVTQEQKNILTNIYKSNERMIELVNTLLNISRIESGRIIITPEPADLKKLVDEVVTEVKPKIDSKKQQLVISIHENLPDINIDAKMIRHVYMNLLTNANKYTPEGGEIMVLISKDKDNLVSQVSDNGFGIPKHQQENVFKKFFRAENILKVETDGTGLGLYLVKSIVEASKGTIWFESEVGKGTTFWFSLPIAGTPAKTGEVSLDA